MLKTPVSGFNYVQRSFTGAVTAVTSGATIVPDINAYGAWSQLISGASVLHDIYGIRININTIGWGGRACDAICNIGIDTAGGTSYTTLIPHLLCSAASQYLGSAASRGGVSFYFPIYIPAGSSVAAQISQNTNPVTAVAGVDVTLFGQPSKPDSVNVGRWVDAIGITTASSSGVVMTQGTTYPATWVSIGSPSRDGWYTELGFGIADATMDVVGYVCDIAAGDASNKRLLTCQKTYVTDNAEQVGMIEGGFNHYGKVTTLDTIYGRVQANNASNSNVALAAYVLGG